MSHILHGILSALAEARPGYVLAAVALHVTGLILAGQRWRMMTAALGSRLTLLRATLVNLAGIFVRNATPATGVGGDASRIALLCAEGVPLAQATASFAYVRLAEVLPLVVLTAVSMPAAFGALARSPRVMTTALVALALAAALAWAKRRALGDRLRPLWQRGRQVRIGAGAMTQATAYAALCQVESIARLMVVAAAFGTRLTVQQAATITVMTIAGGFVPTVGSLGAIDGTYVAGLMLFGVTAETAVAITVVERAISYGVSTVAGAGAVAALGGRGILRRMTPSRVLTEYKTNTAAAG